MLPTVAVRPHVPPHNLFDRRFASGMVINDSYDWNNTPIQTAFSPSHDALSSAAFNILPRTRLHFPQPIQRPTVRNVAMDCKSGLSNNGEHTLRRKTPNGTLAAGYDGTPGERAIQPPATKHLLVSTLDQGQTPASSQLSNALTDDWHQPSVDQKQATHPFNSVWSCPQGTSPNKPLHPVVDAFSRNGNITENAGPSWVRSVNLPSGVDSVLHQTLPTQPAQRFNLYQSPSVPTVLPATLQPCLGPTTPVGTGPYGPYWPDGVYIPYRPAAHRDTRFVPSPSNHNLPHLMENRLSQFGHHPIPNPELASLSTFTWTPKNSLDRLSMYDQPLPPNFPPRHSIRHKSVHSFTTPSNAPYHTRTPHSFPNGAVLQPSDPTTGWHASPSSHNVPPSIPLGASRAQTVEFKEKVLSWAHSVYVDLLATIHEARKNTISKASADGQAPPRSAKPNIYPKPPRQPGLDFSGFLYVKDIQRHNSYPSSTYDLHHHLESKARQPEAAVDSSRMQARQGPSADTRSLLDGSRSARRTSLSTMPRPVAPYVSEGVTMATAASALEMLSHLCAESGWEWTDGVLLGGCLAYGLGDYHKAMRWYSRIINRDTTHVEAISNLAATLLALNRPEEALQYWLRAVKLRPSYFEAVEHLIGLLCSTHRGREAVNIIEYVEASLRVSNNGDCFRTDEHSSETESDGESTGSYDRVAFDYDADMEHNSNTLPILNESNSPGFGSSGYAIPGTDNGRMLALVHAKGNMLYALGDNSGAARAFEDAILIAAGRRRHGIQSLIRQVISAFTTASRVGYDSLPDQLDQKDPVLLYPEKALQTANLVFPPYGNPPGFQFVSEGLAKKAAMSTTSNSLLSLAKIYQDGMSHSSPGRNVKVASGVREILALYYLSLSLQPSPSTANNVGILLASIQHNGSGKPRHRPASETSQVPEVPGVVPGSGISLALAYYNYGLNLDSRHAHLYTNLGSLLKDIGQLQAAIRMYEQAVQCDGTFDIALANLANAVKDAGRINDAIGYYKRAVRVNPEFAEAVCGLANALNSVCNWVGRGGISKAYGFRDRWHVDERAMIREISSTENGSGWMQRVIDIVNQQLRDGETWGRGLLSPPVLEQLCAQLTTATTSGRILPIEKGTLATMLRGWYGKKWEGSRVVRLVERAIRAITWQWYQDRYVYGREYPVSKYRRPQLPAGLTTPSAPTVLPFHTFTYPLSAKQIRHISQRNGLRISLSTLRSSWLPPTVYPPPFPPNPYLKVGYVSSDFNNHPLAHLMQSVFGLHNPKRVKAFCYATTPSDNSIHRSQIERESPAFYDVSGWSVDRLVNQVVKDGIHILVNLNGYTRGARNEVFAARPAPIHMSFMGFAGTLGAEWCDYILADEISIPRETLSPGRRDARVEDRIFEDNHAEDIEDWVYGEKIVFTRDTFFCCDHRQSAPGSDQPHMSWADELRRRWKMRKELFPHLSDDTIILGNFNQLYKIEPTTFRTWLRILARIPNAVLWLLRFPDTGEHNLRQTAINWAGRETASRIIFTDVAPKHAHISRAQVCDLFLDTPECNAHTTAADILWSGTPMLTYPRYKYKMCSRMASSILTSALPSSDAGRQARGELVANSDEDYENKAIHLCADLRYLPNGQGIAEGRLVEMRKMLFLNRWQSELFNTRRWVNDLENAYEKVWDAWVRGEEGDIWL